MDNISDLHTCEPLPFMPAGLATIFSNITFSLDAHYITVVPLLLYTANIYHPAIVKLQPKADKVKEKIYNLMKKGI